MGSYHPNERQEHERTTVLPHRNQPEHAIETGSHALSTDDRKTNQAGGRSMAALQQEYAVHRAAQRAAAGEPQSAPTGASHVSEQPWYDAGGETSITSLRQVTDGHTLRGSSVESMTVLSSTEARTHERSASRTTTTAIPGSSVIRYNPPTIAEATSEVARARTDLTAAQAARNHVKIVKAQRVLTAAQADLTYANSITYAAHVDHLADLADKEYRIAQGARTSSPSAQAAIRQEGLARDNLVALKDEDIVAQAIAARDGAQAQLLWDIALNAGSNTLNHDQTAESITQDYLTADEAAASALTAVNQDLGLKLADSPDPLQIEDAIDNLAYEQLEAYILNAIEAWAAAAKEGLQDANSRLSSDTSVSINWANLLTNIAGNAFWAATILPGPDAVVAGVAITKTVLFAASMAGIGVAAGGSVIPLPAGPVSTADQFDAWLGEYITAYQTTWRARATANMIEVRKKRLLTVAGLARSPETVDQLNHALLSNVFGHFVAPDYNVFAPLNTDLIRDTVAVNLLSRLALASAPASSDVEHKNDPLLQSLGRISYDYEFYGADPNGEPKDFSSTYTGITFWTPPGIDKDKFKQLVSATWGQDGRVDVKNIAVPKAIFAYSSSNSGSNGAVLLQADNNFDRFIIAAEQQQDLQAPAPTGQERREVNYQQWGEDILATVWPSGQPPEASVAKIKVSNDLSDLPSIPLIPELRNG